MASTVQVPVASRKAENGIQVEYLKSYLEYLDKEQTIQGVLCSFCVVAAATVVAKILLTKAADSDLLLRLQGDAFPLCWARSLPLPEPRFTFISNALCSSPCMVQSLYLWRDARPRIRKNAGIHRLCRKASCSPILTNSGILINGAWRLSILLLFRPYCR